MTPQDLVELRAIEQLKYRYMRCLDQKLWDDIAACFTPDATAAYSGGRYDLSGREEIVDFLRRTMGPTTFLSSHRAHHPEIDLVDPDRAVGVWAMEESVVIADLAVTVQGAGFYEDEYVRSDGRWLIAHTGYRLTYEEVFPRSSVKDLRLTGDWWSTDGRSLLG